MKDPKELAVEIAEFLYAKKGENIQVLDVANLTSITEFFVIASARNTICAVPWRRISRSICSRARSRSKRAVRKAIANPAGWCSITVP